MATWPSGKARVCKTLIMGSNPIVASTKKDRQKPVFLFKNSPYAAMLKGGLAFFAPFRVARRVWQGKSQGHSPFGSKKVRKVS